MISVAKRRIAKALTDDGFVMGSRQVFRNEMGDGLQLFAKSLIDLGLERNLRIDPGKTPLAAEEPSRAGSLESGAVAKI